MTTKKTNHLLEVLEALDIIELDDFINAFNDYGYEAVEHKLIRAHQFLDDIDDRGLYNLYKIYLNEERLDEFN